MKQYNDPKGQAGSLKAPLGLVPPYAMEQTSWVHKLGAEKYGPWNWRETGVCASTYVNAILRHLNAWRDGESLDPESGITHLAHIACSANILMDAEYCGKLQDDRNKRPTNNETEEGSLAVGELLTISEFADILKWIRGEDEELEVADCDHKGESPIDDECKCGRRKIYHWLYGWICEDCEIKYSEPY